MTLTTVTGNQLTEGMLVVSGEIYDGNLIDGYYKLVSLSEESTKYNRWMVIYYQATQSIRAKGKYALVVGNGEVNFLNEEVVRRSNAHTLDWNGNAWFAGDIYVGGTGQDDTDANKVVTENEIETIIEEIDNKINSPKKYIKFEDAVNGYHYIVEMRNGNIVSRCAISTIEVTTMPDRTEYIENEYLDTTGMVLTATCYDGNTFEITDYTYANEPLVVGENKIEISYTEYGTTYTTSIIVTTEGFNPDVTLIDFTYETNDDGTYTITGWKQTLNGEPSTEMVIPDYSVIKL
jgi:hypothetical protein